MEQGTWWRNRLVWCEMNESPPQLMNCSIICSRIGIRFVCEDPAPRIFHHFSFIPTEQEELIGTNKIQERETSFRGEKK